MRDNQNLILVGLGVFLAYKVGQKKPGLAAVPSGITSGNTTAELQNIASDIKEVFVNEYFYFDEDENKIKNAFRKIVDQGGYRIVHGLFGQYNSYTRGDGDLDFWMGKLSDATKDFCRQYAYGVANF